MLAGHPWIRNYNNVKVPLDILIFKLMKVYMRSSSLRKAALRVRIFFAERKVEPISSCCLASLLE